MQGVGICFGSSTLTAVIVEDNNSPDGTGIKIKKLWRRTHQGNPYHALKIALKEICGETKIDTIPVVTTGRNFRYSLECNTIPEVEATEIAINFVLKGSDAPNALISAGGENTFVYVLDSKGKIKNIYTGNKCASGTGDFFLQQIKRMNTSLDEATQLALEGDQEYKVSGRCSVFCKSDCTHGLNKGEPKGNVISGLCRMMSQKIIDLLYKVPKEKIMVIGGITKNKKVMHYLRQDIKELVIPEQALYFEALGAALYALKDKSSLLRNINILKKNDYTVFHYLKPLKEFQELVTFKEANTKKAMPRDTCILGLDVGSTTTKAVIIRQEDNALLAHVYIRTNGDPIKASRACYSELNLQINVPIRIIGLGVTGSGRNISGLHALTDGIVNEIVAHSKASAYFDPEVDTIFEIGGQDAKYTFLTNSVPTDYAMNEACSAGTGSFLEEAAHECLGIPYTEIAGIAMTAQNPPNFNDQCSAFISSDIINATQHGFKKEDITAGLVYSICMNYLTRVKGARPVGKKIFMQGGVCYNAAVPLAMASLLSKPIIVPPFPGLMGAFGVALEIKSKIEHGFLEEKEYDLDALSQREIVYGKSTKCQGNNDCDRGCKITNISINGENYPFGGACNKYYNLVHKIRINEEYFNEIAYRQDLIFKRTNISSPVQGTAKKVGFNKSFLTNHLFPLFHTFFTELGVDVILPDKILTKGIAQMGAPFCYPAEIAHGLFLDLLHKKPAYVFLPHITELYQKNSVSYRKEHQSTCLILQGESYYLKSAFKKDIIESGSKIISPIINFSQGWDSQLKPFQAIAKSVGSTKEAGKKAYIKACEQQANTFDMLKKRGKQLLSQLEEHPEKIAIVLFGRPYNAFAEEVNLNIPHKFASRGITIIPFDMLPFEDEKCDKTMYWSIGQMILKAARFVRKHPQLFGVFVTNFSCGPDSFIVGYFREAMGKKPSLTLELDSHTADVGIDTRIEAFLDIIQYWRKIDRISIKRKTFQTLTVEKKGGKIYIKSQDERPKTLRDRSVKVLLPSMGIAAEAIASVLVGSGIRAEVLPTADMEILKKGRSIASCKECVPLILTVGLFRDYIDKHYNDSDKIIYFMPEAPGGCRFGQYHVFLKKYIEKQGYDNVGIMCLSNEDGYQGIDLPTKIRILKATIASDIFTDIKNILSVLAKDPAKALAVYQKAWTDFNRVLQKKGDIEAELANISKSLKQIPLKYSLKDAKKALLTGEIYTRLDPFSCRGIAEKLAQKDIILLTAPSLEWLYYVDVLIHEGIVDPEFNILGKVSHFIEKKVKRFMESRIKGIMNQSGIIDSENINMEEIVKYGLHLCNLNLGGDPILSTGAALKETLNSIHGIILIGPFNCMQSRITEAFLSENMHIETKEHIEKTKSYSKKYPELDNLPFLSIETDGNPYPQLIEARIEAFSLQVVRVHEQMKKAAEPVKKTADPVRKVPAPEKRAITLEKKAVAPEKM
ncbi:MAG: activase [Candidatus Margulisiibacteriota bacterium]|nr:MAG: hypothetical protein A2X42_04730 [Candidatus Margulisbacteria bacterium GWF2_38_17]PZM79558.1 MAG: activase [Candidatus Margulisiibacteriota bacterium]HCY36655.1 activase [Candidatus Margulisiibacteriota bacterium]